MVHLCDPDITCVCSSHQTVLSTRRHRAHPVSALILPPRDTRGRYSEPKGNSSYRVLEIQALWSLNHDTEILHCNAVLVSSKQSRRCHDRTNNVREKETTNTWNNATNKQIEINKKRWKRCRTTPRCDRQKKQNNTLHIQQYTTTA